MYRIRRWILKLRPEQFVPAKVTPETLVPRVVIFDRRRS